MLAARDRIEAARAGQAAAKAAFYPDINLAAFAGTSAVGFDNLFHGSSGAYGAGPAIHLPLFDAGRLRAEYRGAAAEIDDAVSAYNQSVLQAVRETSDQLGLIEALNAQIVLQERSLDDAEAAYQPRRGALSGRPLQLPHCTQYRKRGLERAPGTRRARLWRGDRARQSSASRGRQLRSGRTA